MFATSRFAKLLPGYVEVGLGLLSESEAMDLLLGTAGTSWVLIGASLATVGANLVLTSTLDTAGVESPSEPQKVATTILASTQPFPFVGYEFAFVSR